MSNLYQVAFIRIAFEDFQQHWKQGKKVQGSKFNVQS